MSSFFYRRVIPEPIDFENIAKSNASLWRRERVVPHLTRGMGACLLTEEEDERMNMITRMRRDLPRSVRCAFSVLIAFSAILIVSPDRAYGDVSVTISPHKIVLNAEGKFEDLQAVIRIPVPSGHILRDDFSVTLSLDGTQVAQAFDLRYCYVDDNFLASFDRTAIQQNPTVIDLAGQVVDGRVEGWFLTDDPEGNLCVNDFSGTDRVEIVGPGKKEK